MMCFALDDPPRFISILCTMENMATFVTSKHPILTHFPLLFYNSGEKFLRKIHEFITFLKVYFTPASLHKDKDSKVNKAGGHL